MNRIYAFFHDSEAHPCAFPPQFSPASLHLAVLLQLSEESICGEAAGRGGWGKAKGETSPVPPDPFLLLESLSITFTTNGKGRFMLTISQNRKWADKNSSKEFL